VIPYSITSIGEGAFSGCDKLRQVIAPQRFHHLFLGVASVREEDYDYMIPISVISMEEEEEEEPRVNNYTTYKDCILQVTGIDNSKHIPPEKAEELIMAMMDKAFTDFITMKKTCHDKNVCFTIPMDANVFTEEQVNIMKSQYKAFMLDVNTKQPPILFQTKVNAISVFLALLFQNNMLHNDYYLSKLETITNKINKGERRYEIYNNKKLGLVFHKKKNIVTTFDELLLNNFFYFIFDKKYFIKMYGSSLKTIFTAFTKNIFFFGLHNKEVITHNSILLPFDYINHDIGHYMIVQNNYKNLNKNINLIKFIYFIDSFEHSYNIYFILYFFLFENSNHCFLLNQEPDLQNYICSLLTFEITKTQFDTMKNMILSKSDLKFFDFDYNTIKHLLSEYFLLNLLPKEIIQKIELQKNVKDREKIVLSYFRDCVMTLLEYYDKFMLESKKCIISGGTNYMKDRKV
jgi:hypothetical protein